MRTFRLVVAATIMPVLLMACVASAARASCAAPPTGNPYDDAGLVFVGKVAATEHDGYEAHVVVEQAWRGRVPERIVTVISGPLDSDVSQEDSLPLSSGATYVFAVSGDGPSYSVSACSATKPYAQVPLRYRPSGLPPPTADPALLRRAQDMTDDGPSHLVTAGLVLVLGVLAAGALATWATRRRTRTH